MDIFTKKCTAMILFSFLPHNAVHRKYVNLCSRILKKIKINKIFKFKTCHISRF